MQQVVVGGGQDHAGDEFKDFLEQTDPHFKLGAGGQEAGGQVVMTIASVPDLSQHYPGTADGHLAADQLDPADTEERGGVDHAWVKVGRKVWKRFIVIKVQVSLKLQSL